MLNNLMTTEPVSGAPMMSKHKQPRKIRCDIKLTLDKFQTIENAFKQGLKQVAVSKITGINGATVSAVRLVLGYMGRLESK